VDKSYSLTLDAKAEVRSWLTRNEKKQIWLASKLRVKQSRLSKMLSGQAAMPEAVAEKLAALTGIDVRALADVA
jgi:hypothetical protein